MAEPSTMRWSPTSPWAAVTWPGRFGAANAEPGIHLAPLTDAFLGTVVARAGQAQRVGEHIRARFGIDPPPPGRAHFGRDADLVWSAPDQWLFVAGGRAAWNAARSDLAPVAAVTDQSDGRALLRISGPRSRDMLAKGFAIDLDPRAFSTGSAAVTSIAHIGAQIWQTAETPAYSVAVARSFAGSFWTWLTEAAAEYRYEVGGLTT